jgi:hypothetical protein
MSNNVQKFIRPVAGDSLFNDDSAQLDRDPNRDSNNETDMIAKKSEMFEVTITGGDGLQNRRYKTFDDAKAAALRVLKFYDRVGTRAAHPAFIYGPDCGPDGKKIT